MNLDRLKALIRLANNNPNDNEANLAARKACKILAENNFSLLQPQPRTSTTTKVNEPKTWNDVKRSTESEFKSRPTAPTADMWEDFMNRHFTGGAKRWPGFDWSKAPHKEAPEDNWDRETKNRPPPANPYRGDGQKQEVRKCTKCGLETMTFRYNEVPWICNPCLWKEEKT